MRLTDTNAFDALRARIDGDPRLTLDVKRESQFFADQAGLFATVLEYMAFFVTIIMAIGAVFGAINTMDTLVSARTREIALLLTLGFRPRTVLTTFLFEALLLSAVGGILGCLIALPLHGVTTSTTNFQSFAELAFSVRLSPAILAQGFAFALVMGLIGGFLPARHAAKQVIAEALRKA
jgi:ABC-type antimicrobial peptide transport system permease subunit